MRVRNEVSDDVKRLNPEVFGPVRPLRATERERSQDSALVKKPRRVKASKRSVALCCTIIGCRSRVLDGDNFQAGCKPLRDAIARHFGLDDADDCIQWEYGQVRTDGKQGVIVKIERLTP